MEKVAIILEFIHDTEKLQKGVFMVRRMYYHHCHAPSEKMHVLDTSTWLAQACPSKLVDCRTLWGKPEWDTCSYCKHAVSLLPFLDLLPHV